MKHLVVATGLAALAIAAALAHTPESLREGQSRGQVCYAAKRDGTPPPDFCSATVLHDLEARVLEVDLASHHVRLRHDAVPGLAPAGAHDDHVEPAYLLAAVTVGDSVRVVIESGQRHVIDIYPLLE